MRLCGGWWWVEGGGGWTKVIFVSHPTLSWGCDNCLSTQQSYSSSYLKNFTHSSSLIYTKYNCCSDISSYLAKQSLVIKTKLDLIYNPVYVYKPHWSSNQNTIYEMHNYTWKSFNTSTGFHAECQIWNWLCNLATIFTIEKQIFLKMNS